MDVQGIAYLRVAFFWDVAPCSVVEIDRRFRDAYCLHHEVDRQTHGATSQKTVSSYWSP
jgi:hypothetical protein